MPDDAALRYLNAARAARARGDVADCAEFAQAAYHLAEKAGDGETVYHARACLGRMHGYRAEYPEAYERFRQALREAETYAVERWIGPAHQDCFSFALLAGKGPEVYRPHAVQRIEHCFETHPDRLYGFMHNFAYLQSYTAGHINPRFLHSTAVSASWYATGTAFERMVVAGSQAISAGLAGVEDWYRVAEIRFDRAVEEMGSYEGYAVTVLDLAHGAWALGMRERSAKYITSSRRVAELRGEARVLELAEALERQQKEAARDPDRDPAPLDS